MPEKLALHCCCAPCASAVIEKLQPDFALTLIFVESNIWPDEELQIRKSELEKYARKLDLPLICEIENHDKWRAEVATGLESAPEGGARCTKCFEWRLARVAQIARQYDIAKMASTLTISPHKNTAQVNDTLQKAAAQFEIAALAEDFSALFSRSCAISREEDFYRQKYCGCEFAAR